MIDFIWNLVSFIVALGILVAVHEWGHFWVARRCGVKVERFSIGFGKALWKTKDKLGTEFVIAAIPLGGYVKMIDERVDHVSDEDLPYAFNRQPVLKRIAIVAAGPMVNFLFAILAIYLLLLIGEQTRKPIVGEIPEASYAAAAGLKQGDEIIAFEGRPTDDWTAVNYEIMGVIGEPKAQFKVRSAAGYERNLQLDLKNWKLDPDKQSPMDSLGIVPFRPQVSKKVAYVEKSSPGDGIGLQVNDIILSFNGTTVQNWEQIVELIEQHPQQNVSIRVQRDGNETTLTGRVGAKADDQQKGYLGIIPFQQPYPATHVFVKQYGPVEAIWHSVDETWRLVTLSVGMIGKLFTGDISVKSLSGPISIAQGAGMSASFGIVAFLSFLALISVNLGIINLLPLPVLDGGHLLYYVIELVTGKPVSESVQEVGFKIGGIVLLLLMTIAFYNDIARL
ncbi:sigma E protease regulator RseP [Aliiglaciecola litoralis]|uniref:Zinc metalloprotease n=1 Tax=Aliiglaciecola litoralis TaxID=582857 RepID=A0ABN1LH84_9ALTE